MTRVVVLFIIGYVLLQIAIIAVVVALTVKNDKRYKRGSQPGEGIPPGFIRTDEISLDPVTGIKTRVYYHPESGERIYIKEY